jgi:hypothetical protein
MVLEVKIEKMILERSEFCEGGRMNVEPYKISGFVVAVFNWGGKKWHFAEWRWDCREICNANRFGSEVLRWGFGLRGIAME